MEYAGPGNVRELQNALEHALVLAHGQAVDLRHLPGALQPALGARPGTAQPQVNLEQRERTAIEQALAMQGGHRGRTAAALGISPTTLWRKMKKYGIATQPVYFILKYFISI
eukprot:TRINITY_DN8102_c0_g2_i1.p4 TRINITY_DN8102_c0_g2~~TRINITY_DN8102_c0_g2_i1.p4  ORF type:complete len:112 (-),score=44.68 TRINITY_DN8102_c0_g2_i1:408-743(-)